MRKAELIAENQALKEHQKVLEGRLVNLQNQLVQLLKLIKGNKSERFNSLEDISDQLNLFASSDAVVEDQKNIPTKTIEYEKKITKTHNGRNPIPDHLPVEEIVIEPEQETTGLKKIGEEITETLEYTPASLVKKRIIRPKYAKVNDEGVLIGKLPRRPIDKCIAEASLLAYILISKFGDHRVLRMNVERIKTFNAVLKMRVGPSKSACRSWFQTAVCCSI